MRFPKSFKDSTLVGASGRRGFALVSTGASTKQLLFELCSPSRDAITREFRLIFTIHHQAKEPTVAHTEGSLEVIAIDRPTTDQLRPSRFNDFPQESECVAERIWISSLVAAAE